MSSKYYVFTEWQEFDKDAKAHVIKASTPFSAAVAYAIRERGLYHAAETRYEVYDSRGTVCGKFTVPDWVDDTFGETMKEAFLIEVVVERNESGATQDGSLGCGCSTGSPCAATAPAAALSSQYHIPAPSSAAPLDWGSAKCKGCGERSKVYLRVDTYDDKAFSFCLAEKPVLSGDKVLVGDTEISKQEIADLASCIPDDDFVVLCDCLGSCEDETSLEILRKDGTMEDEDAHFLIEYVEMLSSMVGLPFTRPTAVAGSPIACTPSPSTVAVAPVREEQPSSAEPLEAKGIEFAAYKDGRVVLQGAGYFEFYGGLDDESIPYIEREFSLRHGLVFSKGNAFSTRYTSCAEAEAALKADGATHNPDLQAFIDA